ncbi:VapA/VapB family virulence-associated protein [Prescottella equi]|uniref:VapA/VapB family virulence-associated protein n=1 Tax=Rhodococcus hoagii TaxID=43767 RepID=UPI0039C3FF93
MNTNLFAGDGSLLGHVQSGALSSLVDIGGGKGAWRQLSLIQVDPCSDCSAVGALLSVWTLRTNELVFR